MRFLQIAAGSTSEVENHLLIAASLGYLAESVAEEIVGQASVIRLMLNKLMKNLPA